MISSSIDTSFNATLTNTPRDLGDASSKFSWPQVHSAHKVHSHNLQV
jgi:hypothetical protein